MADRPLVSVLTAAYNQEDVIGETLESALGQSYENLEVVVADDVSDDGTRDVVRGFAGRYPGRVKLIEATERRGPCRRRNDALAASEGELIAWLDGDDLWLPGKVEKQVAVFESDPEVGLVHTGFEKFDGETGAVVPGGVETVPQGDMFEALYTTENFIGSLTAMFRREALAEPRLRDVEFAYGDDYWAWLEISLAWKVGGVDEVLARYRMHGGNLSHKQGNHILKRIELLEDFAETYPHTKEKLGWKRRSGMGRQWLAAARMEREREGGSAGKAFGYWGRGFLRAPLAPAVRRHRELRHGLGARLGRGE